MNNEEIPSQSQYYGQGAFADVNTRIRDIEEKTRILKDRVLIMGKNLVEERESTFSDIQELKSEVLKIKLENTQLKEAIANLSQHLEKTARKEDFEIIKRQLDILRE